MADNVCSPHHVRSLSKQTDQTVQHMESKQDFPVVRATLAIMIDKVPATHVASPKLPYPLPGSGRRAVTLACRYTEAPNQVENNP